jgi:flagellar hook-associated protein FlgK
MSNMLGISSGAIGAYQLALSTVSNNIANVNTEGYSRQDVVLADSAPKQLPSPTPMRGNWLLLLAMILSKWPLPSVSTI